MAQEIGAIEIGVGVNVSKLTAELQAVQKSVDNAKFKEREITVRVKLQSPTDAAIKRVQERVVAALNKAGKGGEVTLTPTLVVSDITADKFISNLQHKIGEKEVAVPIVAEINETAIRTQIREAIGTVDIGLTWHWEGDAPPGGAGPGGHGSGPGPTGGNKGGGGGGGTGGGSAPHTGGGGAGAGSKAGAKSAFAASTRIWTEAEKKAWREEYSWDDYQSAEAAGLTPPYTIDEFKDIVAKRGSKIHQAASQGSSAPPPVRQTAPRGAKGRFVKAPPVQQAPATGAPAEATAAGSFAGSAKVETAATGGVFGAARKLPLADSQRPTHAPVTRPTSDPTIERAAYRLLNSVPGGLEDLLKLGGVIKSGGLSFKKRSVLGKAPQEQQDQIVKLFQQYQAREGTAEDTPDIGPRRTSTEPPRKLADTPLGISKEEHDLNNFLKALMSHNVASRKSQRYRESGSVKAFKAEVARLGGGDSGFLEKVLGPATGLKPNIGTNPHGIPTLLPSGYHQEHAGDPAYGLYPSLRDAMTYMEDGQTDVARTIARHHLASAATTDPKLFARLLSIKRMRETDVKTGEDIAPDPQSEAYASAMQAIFGEANIAEAPRREQREKIERTEAVQQRSTRLEPIEHAAREAEIKAKERSGGRTGSSRGDLTEDLDKEGQRRLRAEEKRLTHRVSRREHLQGLVGRIAKKQAHPFGEISIIPAQRDKFGQLPPFSKRAEGGPLPWDKHRQIEQQIIDFEKYRKYNDSKYGKGFTDEAIQKRRAQQELLKRGRAEGGELRHTGLLGRAGNSVTMVGERGPELLVQGQNGDGEVVPTHKMSSFWNRMKHAAGGIAFHGPGGRYQAQGSAAGAAVQAGLASSLAGAIQRVFVVNWPHGGGFGAGQGAAQGAPASATAGQAFTAAQAASLGQSARAGLNQAAASKKTKPEADVPLTPLQAAQQAARTQDLVTAERLKQKGLAAQIQASIKEAPTRGTPTSVGEISAVSLGGLRNVIGRRRLADEATQRSSAALNLYSKAQEKLGILVEKSTKAQDPKKIAEFTQRITEQHEAVDFLEKRYEKLSGEAAELGKNVISGADKLKIFGANTLGVITGTVLYSAALGAAQAGITAMGAALGPVVERLGGFQNVSAKITDSLADQTRASGGNTKATIAAAEAQTGLSAATAAQISPALELRASTEAGNKALAEQIDLIHTAQAVQSQNKGLPGGTDKGLFATTGGQFGTDFGGVASTSELITNELNTLPNAAERAAPPPERAAGSVTLGGKSGVTIPNAGAVGHNPALDDFNKALNNGTDLLEAFNADAQKGGESVLKLSEVSQDQANASAAIAAQSPALQGFAKTLRERSLAVTGAAKPEDFARFLQSVNLGSQTPSAQLLINQASSRQIPNAVAGINAEEQQITLPTQSAQRALDFLSNRPLPFGAGIVPVGKGVEGEPAIGPGGPSSIGKFKGVDPAAAQSFNQYKDVATSALNAVIAKAKEGEQALTELGVPPELVTEMTKLGKEAAGIQLGVADRQAKLEASEYSHELFILNRNLADAEALTGKRVGREGELGRLQRENFDLGKKQQALQFESQALSLALSQKQINFQRALAGFQAPGETGQERAARIAEAKVEADYAQKQLNIQKQLFALGKTGFKVSVRLFDVEAQRQVQDLKFALADLGAQHKLSLDMKSADQALAAIRAREGQVATGISNAIDKSNKFASARIAQAVDIANQTGEAFSTILTQTGVTWTKFIKQGTTAANAVINALTPRPQGEHSAGTTQSGSQSSGITHNGANAPGYFGTVSSATSMIVGEAGTETIAVLRNPRIHSLQSPTGGGGGGGATIVIDVHDNNISGDKDEERIVARISRAVEQSMNRKGALLSLRTV
jgi:hypothetical protein